MIGFLHDLRLAVRRLARSQGFTAVAILTLALGIGANVAIFTLVDSALLRPLPFPDPDRLVALYERNPHNGEPNVLAPANLLDWREASRSFESMGASVQGTANLAGFGEPREIRAAYVSTGFFPTLGVRPEQGRLFSSGPDSSGAPEVVLSHGFYERNYAGRPAVGSTIRLDDELYTVTGVLSERFEVPGYRSEVWIRFPLIPGDRTHFGRFLSGYGRLRSGVTLDAAQSELSAIAARLAEQYPDYDKDWGVLVRPLREALLGSTRGPLLFLLGAVGLLLLIVCANLANLLLSRAAGRSGEMAVRLSVGASRGQLVRQLLSESLVLAVAGGSLGLLLGSWGADALARGTAAIGTLTAARGIHMGNSVILFTLGVTTLTAVLFGLVPAWTTSAMAAHETLRLNGRGLSSDAGRSRLRSGLIVFEVAIAMALLAASGLLARSFRELNRIDPGFRAEHAIAMRLSLSSARYGDEGRRLEFADRLLARLRGLPGVRAAGAINSIPIAGSTSRTRFAIEGEPARDPAHEPAAEIRTVAGDYFQAMRIPLIQGRVFDLRDDAHAPRAFVIDERLARTYFPGQDPVGRRLTISWGEPITGTIVGVVGSVRMLELEEQPFPAVYWWNPQMPSALLDMVVRTSSTPELLTRSMTAQVRALDPEQVVSEVRPLRDILANYVARPRLMLLLVACFAGTALVLAGVGLYGVISVSVAQRFREIGIRMALGASPRSVESMVVRQGLILTAAGLLVGLGLTLAASRFISGALYGVPVWDPLSLGGAALFLAVVSFVASWIPARRAVRIDPMAALRQE